MIKNLKYILKRNTLINNLILKVKFSLNLGLENEAKYLLKDFKFENSVDVGSNSGHFSNLLSKLSKQVYSFEPIPYLYINQQKLFKNKNVKVFNCALGNKSTKKLFYIPKYNDPEASFLKVNKESKIIKVEIERGDKFLSDKKIDFVKIDVEGFEYEVLMGLKNTIKKNNPFFLIEIEKRHNSKYLDIFYFMKKKNYEIFYYDIRSLNLKKIKFCNVVNFIKNKQRNLNSSDYVNNFFFKKNHFFENK